MLYLVLFILSAVVCSLIFGYTLEWAELRNNYLFNGSLKKGKKQAIYYKFKKKRIWNGWNYYYVHADADTIELIPPILFKFFMPKMKLMRNTDGVSETQGKVWFKEKIIYESNNCSVLLAFEPSAFNSL